MHSPYAEAQLLILSKSQLIKCKQVSIFSLRVHHQHTYEHYSEPEHPVDHLYTYRTIEAPVLIPGEHLY